MVVVSLKDTAAPGILEDSPPFYKKGHSGPEIPYFQGFGVEASTSVSLLASFFR